VTLNDVIHIHFLALAWEAIKDCLQIPNTT